MTSAKDEKKARSIREPKFVVVNAYQLASDAAISSLARLLLEFKDRQTAETSADD